MREVKRKQPKIKNAVYDYKGRLIGINGFLDRDENRIVFDELPKKQPIQADFNRVEFILNWSDIRKPSSYYRLTN